MNYNINVLAIIYTSNFGGPHNQVKQLFNSLKENGYTYKLCVPKTEQKYQVDFIEQGIEIYNYSPKRIRYKNALMNLVKYFLFFPIDIFNFYKIIQKSNSQIIQICGLMCLQAGIAARLAKKKIVWQLLSTYAPKPLRYIFIPFVWLLSHKIMTTGISTAIQHPFYKFWKKKLITFYPPVDENTFYPNQEKKLKGRKFYNIPSNNLVIGTLGNKSRQKNHSSLVNFAEYCKAKSSNINFFIAGNEDPEYKDTYYIEVINSAERKNLFHKNFLTITDSSMGSDTIINTIDIFILTSLSEGTPTVIIEALACGKPVIAPDVGSIKEMLDGNPYCFVYSKFNLEEICNHINFIKRSNFKHISKSCRNLFLKRFSFQVSLDNHIKAFDLTMN